VNGYVIDGDQWIARRLAFLRERLAGELPDADRAAVEAEIAALSKERGLMPGGVRVGRIFRWMRRKAQPRSSRDDGAPS
jgi:hypothetical protein